MDIETSRPVDRREQILAGAARLFSERGFSGVSMHDIGESAGITSGAVYKHFRSKRDLLRAILLEGIDLSASFSKQALNQAGSDTYAPLRGLADSSIRLVREHSTFIATYIRERRGADEELRRELRFHEAIFFQVWSEAILDHQPQLPPQDVAARTWAAIGVLVEMARQADRLASPQLRNEVQRGIAAILATPAAPTSSTSTSTVSTQGWVPPQTRRQQILDAATSLFAMRGFNGVGLDEVGNALGIAGPSIYEHFATKVDLLLDACDRADSLLIAGALGALRDARNARQALTGLALSSADICFENIALIYVATRGLVSLPNHEKLRIERRRRDFHEIWIAVLREIRPELSIADARFLVSCALGIVESLAWAQNTLGRSVEQTAVLIESFLISAPTDSGVS